MPKRENNVSRTQDIWNWRVGNLANIVSAAKIVWLSNKVKINEVF